MFFPLKKLRRQVKYVLLGAILLVGAVAMYHEIVASKSFSSGLGPDRSVWKMVMFEERVGRAFQQNLTLDSPKWDSSYTPQTWKTEYKGLANLHVFEDWCGSSTADLCRNLHYPLYPHTRTTVSKLAVSPQWTNYGLRIFGFLHPYADGDFVFALSSDDNADLWLSTDDSPLNVQLLAWVGKTGTEWTAPGEFQKYASQMSRPVRLSAQKKYFFEVIHKQNDRGTDHVEVAWLLKDKDFMFTIIESKHISLYTDESALLMGEVAHIPQTAASHQQTHKQQQQSAAADMLKEEPRDTFYQVPLIDSKFLEGVLPDCSYKPTYRIKGFPLTRYQGLQFVHMSYVYPNDYTRLTHMEKDNSCFYPENPSFMKLFGFSRYMRLDQLDMLEKENTGFGFQRRGSAYNVRPFDNAAYKGGKKVKSNHINNDLFQDYGDDYDDYAKKVKRKLFSLDPQESDNKPDDKSDTRLQKEDLQMRQENDKVPEKPRKPPQLVTLLPQKQEVMKHDSPSEKIEPFKVQEKSKSAITQKSKSATKSRQKPPLPLVENEKPQAIQQATNLSEQLSSQQLQTQRSHQTNHTQLQKPKDSQLPNPEQNASLPKQPVVSKQKTFVTKAKDPQPPNVKRVTTRKSDTNLKSNKSVTDSRKHLRDNEIERNIPLQQNVASNMQKTKVKSRGMMYGKWSNKEVDEVGNREVYKGAESKREKWESKRDSRWGLEGDSEATDDVDLPLALEYDTLINWNQTFQVKHMDLQAMRSDWIDLSCNVSGNLLLSPSDALPIVEAFMKQLNTKHHERFTLTRVVNVVKRVDGSKGSRYLLELELKDLNGQTVRLTHYIYALIRHSRTISRDLSFQRSQPQIVLCNPVGFRWNSAATVHFIVPVKNQARWVKQLIADMEMLFRETADTNFNLIITDYNSTDMDVRKALQKSSLPRYQYVKLSGNFERSAGLQAGINLIDDDHSIVFLCDLHIHFPLSIIDTIRKHCVEGYMAFAPIVLRLNCGTTPLEAQGYWEVNGFGLLGIYKSDLIAAGGMNTQEFKERWGGEDWELLDRLLQAGLEVDRIYLKNFFHYFHSKRGMWNRRMSANRR